MFEYLEQSTSKEKDRIANDLAELYNGALLDEQNCFQHYRQNKRSGTAQREYAESVQRLGAITDVLDILHIKYEGGQPIELLQESV